MSLQQSSVHVTIYGTDYPIRGDGDSTLMYQIAQYLDEKMSEIGAGQNMKVDRIAILAALNIAEELFTERENNRNAIEKVTEECKRLSHALEEKIGGE
jgi:cell division protein ZapA